MKNYILAGFISFFLMEVGGLIYAQVLGRFESSDVNLLGMSLFLGCSVGIIGIIFGVLFSSLLKSIPTKNEYINAPLWIILISVGLSIALGGIKKILHPDMIFTIPLYIATGVIFIKITRLKQNKSNQQVEPIGTTPVDKVEAQSTQAHP